MYPLLLSRHEHKIFSIRQISHALAFFIFLMHNAQSNSVEDMGELC
jgi:hypothetical protein